MVSQFFVEEYRGMDIDRWVLDAGDPRGYQLFCWFPLQNPYDGCRGTTDVTCNNGGPGYATIEEVRTAIDIILDFSIINGKFEDSSYSLPGWTVYYQGGYPSQVLIKTDTLIVDGQPGPGVDGNAARLYVDMCGNARISQDVIINKKYLLFDWVTYTIAIYPENIGFRIRQGTTTLYSESIASQQNSHRNEKTHVVDVSAYLYQTVTIEFYIEQGAYCYYGDHGNNWLWIDNVELSDTIIPCVPNWQCELPLNGYENDANNCGELRRLNITCNAPIQTHKNNAWMYYSSLALFVLYFTTKKKHQSG